MKHNLVMREFEDKKFSNFKSRGCMAMCCSAFPYIIKGNYNLEEVKQNILHLSRFIFSRDSRKVRDLHDDSKIKVLNYSIEKNKLNKQEKEILSNSLMLHLKKMRGDFSNHFCILYDDAKLQCVCIYDPAFDGVFFDFDAFCNYYSNYELVGYRKFPFLASKEVKFG